MRIGVSTGEAFVGDYGSDTKWDYTCIGDTVNLGSRLEAANKCFGTQVLVDQATRERAGDRLVFRSLGLLTLPGKTDAVAVSELIGAVGEVDEANLDYVACFERVVRCFQGCQWASCLEAIAQCSRLKPKDPAIEPYAQAVEAYRKTPPPVDWNRAIDVAVK